MDIFLFEFFGKLGGVAVLSSIKFTIKYFSGLDDYDIKFLQTSTTNNFIELGIIDKDFKEFTFSAWIKFKPGYIKYPLISYNTENTTDMVALGFRSADTGEGSGDTRGGGGDTGGESEDTSGASEDTTDNGSEKTIEAFSGNLFGQHVG